MKTQAGYGSRRFPKQTLERDGDFGHRLQGAGRALATITFCPTLLANS